MSELRKLVTTEELAAEEAKAVLEWEAEDEEEVLEL